MPRELRFDCSFLWQMSVDDDIELTQATAPVGEIWKARAADAQNIAAAVDVREHVVLVKKTGAAGQKEWTFRLAPGIAHNPLVTGNGRTLRCAEDSNILPLNVASEQATTVFTLSKVPSTAADVASGTFKSLKNRS
jgi:hypothetical protein